MAEVKTMFDSTIKVQDLTFQDWQLIAASIGQRSGWAYFSWVQGSKPDLSSLTIEDWEQVKDKCGFKDGWAYWQYKNNRG